MKIKQILMIDDDTELCRLMEKLFVREGLAVEFAHSGENGLNLALANEYQIVVLDVMLPVKNGFDVLREIRRASAVPILMLTARGDAVDKIVGLEMGADDYLPKPFDARELVARIRAILRRVELDCAAPQQTPATENIVVGDLEMSLAARTVRCNHQAVELTAAEFDVLLILVRAAGQVVARDELARLALGRKLSVFDRSVDMLISKIRKKLEQCSSRSERIRAIRSVGYAYSPVDKSRTVKR